MNIARLLQSPLGEPLIIERYVNGEPCLINIDAPPKHVKQRNVIERRCQLLPFVRIRSDNEKFLDIATVIGTRIMRTRAQNNVIPTNKTWASKLPQGSAVLRETMHEIGAVACGHFVEEVIQFSWKYQQTLKMGLTPEPEKGWKKYERTTEHEMLLFFEDEEQAVLARLRFG